MLIFSEGCGTCSTKHAALAALCREHSIEAQLQMVICKLDIEFDPKTASFLDKLGVGFFPEAHCYLWYLGHEVDVTFPDQLPVLNAKVLQSYIIQPEQIGDHKGAVHSEYLLRWLEETGLHTHLSLNEVWCLREAWIDSLSTVRLH